MVVVVVVAGTIAPSRDLPELSAEDTIRIILSNLNLVVPVVAALLVIIIAIIVICILRSKGNHHKGIYKYIQLITNFVFFSVPLSLSLTLSTSLTLDTRNKPNNEHSRLFSVSLSTLTHTHIKYRISFCLANCPVCCCCIRYTDLHARLWFVYRIARNKGTIAPLDDGLGHNNVHARIPLPAWMPEWLDLNFMVPLIATVVVVAVGICVVCVALSRRRSDDMRGGQKDVYCRLSVNDRALERKCSTLST